MFDPHDLPAARGRVQHERDVALGAGAVAIEDLSAGDERAGAGGDDVGLGLAVVRDAGRAARRARRDAAGLGLGRSTTTSAATAAAGRSRTRRRAGRRTPTVDDSDGQVQVTDVPTDDPAIGAGRRLTRWICSVVM
jgi:hypothetical protein